MDVELFCPLGKKCEEKKRGKVYRCQWYEYLDVIDHRTPDVVVKEYRCSLKWLTMQLHEIAKFTRGQTAAIEDFRNHSVGQQIQFNGLMHKAVKRMGGGDQRLIDVDGDDSTSD